LHKEQQCTENAYLLQQSVEHIYLLCFLLFIAAAPQSYDFLI